MNTQRKILITAALPYANGEIHLGHLLEYTQADIWNRFQKLRGHDSHYFCADDTHGTPIMISARKKGVSPEDFILEMHAKHAQDFADFEIEFDNFYTTHSEENKELSAFIFQKMKEQNHIEVKTIEQAYCQHDKMFLPDRFVQGTCPKCKAENQYGDACEQCSATYQPAELVNAKCTLCGNKPITKDSEHIFFKLNDHKSFLSSWVSEHTQKEVSNKMMEWFEEDLRNWDISRDAPYFGFEIPGHPGKYFYVWLDAPIGYIASSKNWAIKNGRNYEEFWKSEDAEIYHFIGKDITYFHTLFWPAMLKTAGFNLPKRIQVHGFVKVNGEKMSKSKGTFINARTYLNHADPMYLRYYYASKLSSNADDIDLNLNDFVHRVNSELIGKITNLASRGAQMLTKKLDSIVVEMDSDGAALFEKVKQRSSEIAHHYESFEYSKALKLVRDLAEEANKYFDEKQPWKTIKEDPNETKKVLSSILYIFRALTIYLKPVLPKYAHKVEVLYNEPAELNWSSLQDSLLGRKLNSYKHLAQRLDMKNIDKIIEEEKSKMNTTEAGSEQEHEYITIDDLMKVELKTGKVVECIEVEGADKLLQLQVDLGEQKNRNIIAGIKSSYTPSELINKTVIVVANLKPRKMKFGTSEGMILAVKNDKGELAVLSPDKEVAAGVRAK
jgi:methionyl-tRNA synthetase